MSRRKRWWTAMLSALALAVMLAGCGGSGGSGGSSASDGGGSGGESNSSKKGGSGGDQPKPVTITYSEWGTGDQLNQAQELLDAFMKKYPHITVKLEGKDWGTYWQSLTAAAAGGALPDVYKMSFAYVDTYADLGIMKPLDDLIADKGFNTSDIPESVLAMHKYNGQQMSLPIDANVIMFFYNQALFDDPNTNPKKANYPSQNPTWEEIRDLAMKMTLDEHNRTPLDEGFDKTKIKQWGLSVSPSAQLDTVIEPALFSNGAKLLNDDGSLALDTPEAREVLEFFIDMTRQGINTNYAQVTALGGDAGSSLASGKVAMVVAGNWYTGIFDSAGITYGITHMPSFGGSTTTVVQPAGVAMSATTKNEEAAFTLLSWLAGPEGQKLKGTQGAGLPSNQHGRETYVDKMGDKSSIFFDAQQYGIHSPYNKLKGELVFTLSQQLLQKAFDGEEDLDTALQNLEQQLKNVAQ